MTTKTIIPILIILTFSFAYGQKNQIKKETKIVTTFDYDYIKDGKLYLSKKGKVRIDTIFLEFNTDGTLKKEYQNPSINIGKPFWLDSIVLLSTDKNIKYQREYWSDKTLIDICTQDFGDSIIQIKTMSSDTIQINKSYFYKGQLVKSHNRDLRDSYGQYNEIIIYDKKTKNREIATKITTYFKDGLTDTVRVDNNKKKKLYKTLIFNSDKNEWFVSEKTKYYNRKKVFWETFYHDFHKMYFTTKTTTIYNKLEKPVTETKYDTYLRHIEMKSNYYYEYY